MTKVDAKQQLEQVFKVKQGNVTIAIKPTYGDAVEAGLNHNTFNIIASQRKVVHKQNKACGPYGFRYYA